MILTVLCLGSLVVFLLIGLALFVLVPGEDHPQNIRHHH